MTDPQFAVAIDLNGLNKAQLLTIAGALADRVEGYPTSLQNAVKSGAITAKQANVLDAVKAVRGDAWAAEVALRINVSPAAVAQAGQVKDWISLNKGATETEIRATFPGMDDATWTEVKRYLINAKLIQQAFR